MVHVKVEYSDGTDDFIEAFDLERAAAEIHETVTGCNFATTISRVALVDKNDKELKELKATWSLTLSE